METRQHEATTSNPLAKHFRQPNIYIQLPSQGQYWPPAALNLPVNGEIGILPMTTKDEIVLKTPDALINGQGVVNVIHSCCPSIKDAWNMPSIDADAVLIAIRIASYGKQMDFKSKCPYCNHEGEYAIDLTVLLAGIQSPDYSRTLYINGMKIKFKPQPYSSVNKTNMIAFEEQQLLRSLSAYADNPNEAKTQFDLHLAKVLELNTALITSSIESITLDDGTIVTQTQYIEEFLRNAETQVVKDIRQYLTDLAKVAGIKPIDVSCNGEACDRQFPIALTFDYASFFG